MISSAGRLVIMNEGYQWSNIDEISDEIHLATTLNNET